MKPKILVAYLLWTPNAVDSFLESYRHYPAGIQHDLLILDKGGNTIAPEGYNTMKISDHGRDIYAYSKLIPISNKYDYIVFFASSSVIKADDWLLKLYSAICLDKAGIVGATGGPGTSRSMNDKSWWRKIIYPPYPNYHIRTTGFMLGTNIMRKIWPYYFNHLHFALNYMSEHGRNNITNRVEALGLKALVVDKHGKTYEKQHWVNSNTFRIGGQTNLLFADKQTAIYENASELERAILCEKTWRISDNDLLAAAISNSQTSGL
jgi:hypothetical protein